MDFGKPSKEVFAKVPKEYIIDSNYGDTLECVTEITNNPVYCILNLCRFYALIKEDLTLSYYDGGKWALENMGSSYNEVIKKAMDDYLSDTKNTYDNDELREFAKEAIEKINNCLSKNKVIAKQIYKKEMVYLIKVKLVKKMSFLPDLVLEQAAIKAKKN